MDNSIIAYTLTLPSKSTLANLVDVVDPTVIHKARGEVEKELAREYYQTELKEKYDASTADMKTDGEFKVDDAAIGR
jgi:hypothetical protein